MNKIEYYNFKVESFHVDCSKRLQLGVLGNHLLNAAGRHAAKRGFGISKLQAHNYTWVLSRLAIEFEMVPTETEEITIETWIEAAYRLFTDRNFVIRNSDGNIYGYARSVWAMIDLTTRKPVDLLTMNAGALSDWIDTERPCPCNKPGRIRCASTEPIASYSVLYTDIDINGHHNSMKYIDHILNIYPLDFLRKHPIRRFEIAFLTEGHYGDKINLLCDESNNIEVKRGGEVLCHARIDFEK